MRLKSVWLLGGRGNRPLDDTVDFLSAITSLMYTHTHAHFWNPTWVTSWQTDCKYVLKYASKPSVLVHPNRHAQADKAPQRQLISHWLCWGPVWARLWSTDRETDGAGLAGGVSAVLCARMCKRVCVCIYMHLTDCLCTLLLVNAFSGVFVHFQTEICTPRTSYAGGACPRCFLLPR